MFRDFVGIVPGATYELGFVAKSEDGPDSRTPQVKFKNLTREAWMQTDGTWTTTNADASLDGLVADDTWQPFAFEIRIPVDYDAGDTYRIGFQHGNGGKRSAVFFDELSLVGPSVAGEECDDGNDVDDDACDNDCVPNFCGDGEVNNGELCDDGNDVDDEAAEIQRKASLAD